MIHRFSSAALGFLLLTTPHCGGSLPESPDAGVPGADGGESGDGGQRIDAGGVGTAHDGGCRVPDVHVAHPVACGMAAGLPADAAPTSCTIDSDCSDAGPTPGRMPSIGCLHGQCSASDCTTNDDCTEGGVCSCQGNTSGYAHSSFGNTCIPAGCRSDSDCGPGGYCSPTVSGGGPFYGIQGYYCHSCKDECTNDSDCDNGGCFYCAYNPDVGHWACGHTCAAG
jgi:hypothetical protein